MASLPRHSPESSGAHVARMEDALLLAREGFGKDAGIPNRPLPGPPMGRGPRVLLLTSSLGSGHVRAAQAIELAMHARNFGANVLTLDFWSLMDARVAQAVRTAYLRLVQEHPGLFDRIYHLDQSMWRAIFERSEPPPAAFREVLALLPRVSAAMEPGDEGTQHPSDRLMLPLLTAALSGRPRGTGAGSRLLRLGLVQTAWARLSRRLVAEIDAFAPDVIVATQMNSAALLSWARKKGRLRIPTIGVPTDYGLHDFWRQTSIDCYCVAHEYANDAQSTELDPRKVIATGIPLMPGFCHPPPPHEARKSLGLDSAVPVVLVTGGGLGLGVQSVARDLLAIRTPLQLLVVAGHNSAALRALRPLTALHPDRLRVYEWTDSMEIFVSAADIVVGKPGGLTVAEVLACGRPLLATRALGGQEGFNVRFLERHGVGRLFPEAGLKHAVEDLLSHPEALRGMKRRAWALGRRSGADSIAELIQRAAGTQSASRTEARH